MMYVGDSPTRISRCLTCLALVVVLAGFSLQSLAQNVIVKVTILEIKNISVEDGLDEVDWYATVTIAGEEMDNEDEADEDEGNDHLFPNWEFSKSVPLADGTVAVNIEIRDEDDFLKFGDDLADINPFDGPSSIDVTVELEPCHIVAPRLQFVEGDSGPTEPRNIPGLCRESFVSASNKEPGDGDGRAEIRFKVEVLNTPGLLARCTHTPLWPQPNQAVTLKVEALDGNVNLKTADTLEIVRENLPDDTAANQKAHSLMFTPGGDDFAYGCRVIDDGVTVFSDWRRVRVGDPPAGERAVEVLYNTMTPQGVDILLVPDKQSYPGEGTDPQFLEHAASVIYDALGGFYSEPVFLERQHQLNFYLAMDTGEAGGYDGDAKTCDLVAPAGYDTEYAFAEAAGILHTDFFRDCARRSEQIFSAEPPALHTGPARRVIIHEAGHTPFGLADEYCDKRPGALGKKCDGGYGFPTAFFPNVFGPSSPVSCADDANMEGMDTSPCDDDWIDNKGKGPYSTYDPVRNDLMNDKGGARFLDRRRIEGVFDNCPEGGC